MRDSSRICDIVIPCFNEARRLDPSSFESFLTSGDDVQVTFVNDGSTDATLEVLERLRERLPHCVKILNMEVNQGKAAAVRKGMLQAIAGGATYVGYWDADLATPLAEVITLLTILRGSMTCELVIGSRVRLLGRLIERRPIRHYLGRCFATVASIMLRLPIYDTQCGAKLFRVTADLSKVLEAPFVSRWIFDVEIIARFIYLHNGKSHEVARLFYEYPLMSWRDVDGSKVSPFAFVKAISELLRISRLYSR